MQIIRCPGVDKKFLETPWYGSRQMARYMQRQGYKCGRHRVRRLMRHMASPGSCPLSGHLLRKYPAGQWIRAASSPASNGRMC